MNRRNMTIAAAVIGISAVSGATGYFLATNGPRHGPTASADESGRRILYWYDPMVPAEHHSGPGKSSMNMDLIPKYADDGAGVGVSVSPAMIQNLGVRVAKVEVRDLGSSLTAVGRVEFDERLISEVQTLTPGFVERLAVRAEGEPVSAGRVVAQVYSPELLAAQSEYKALLGMNRGVASGSLRQAARNRLRLLGLPAGAIRRLERGGAPQRTYAVVSPASGIVTRIGARSGAQVTPGQSIVTLGGLSRVLVIADVPESSLGSVRVGQPVEIAFPAYGGEVRRGAVDYIYPSLNAEARTARVRITLANPGLRLKAGMFANVTLQGSGGMAVVVPSEAVIDTGRRRVVVVRRNGAFVPVEVTLGRDAGDWTQILAGLQPGEEVVTSGQFLIDSEASLSGVVARLGNAAGAQQAVQPHLVTATGVVLSIDAPGRRVTIGHPAVPAMKWPARRTNFAVDLAGTLRGLRRGERVEFSFDAAPRGDVFVLRTIRQDPHR
jgi:Cu(I)/Ag(I) efflux system membrane fusion protein